MSIIIYMGELLHSFSGSTLGLMWSVGPHKPRVWRSQSCRLVNVMHKSKKGIRMDAWGTSLKRIHCNVGSSCYSQDHSAPMMGKSLEKS